MSSNLPNNEAPFSLALLIKLVPCPQEPDVSSELIERDTNLWRVH